MPTLVRNVVASRCEVRRSHAAPSVLPRSRRATVTVRATSLKELTDQVAQAFVTIFSPPRDTLKNYEGTQNSFSGTRLHSQGRRPFKDGYDATAKSARARVRKASSAESTQEEPEAPNAVSAYLEGAIGRVMGHQFKGDKTASPRSSKGTAVEGWKARLHSRDRDGFHSLNK